MRSIVRPFVLLLLVCVGVASIWVVYDMEFGPDDRPNVKLLDQFLRAERDPRVQNAVPIAGSTGHDHVISLEKDWIEGRQSPAILGLLTWQKRIGYRLASLIDLVDDDGTVMQGAVDLRVETLGKGIPPIIVAKGSIGAASASGTMLAVREGNKLRLLELKNDGGSRIAVLTSGETLGWASSFVFKDVDGDDVSELITYFDWLRDGVIVESHEVRTYRWSAGAFIFDPKQSNVPDKEN